MHILYAHSLEGLLRNRLRRQSSQLTIESIYQIVVRTSVARVNNTRAVRNLFDSHPRDTIGLHHRQMHTRLHIARFAIGLIQYPRVEMDSIIQMGSGDLILATAQILDSKFGHVSI